MSSKGDVTATFRAKVVFMKNFKAASTISNRDRLELYALHKQAVSGDAPSTFPASANGAERAKYQAWRSKSGLTSETAMNLYLQESDRQIRVYGSVGTTNTSGETNSTNTSSSNNSQNSNNNSDETPRGLAAIPLLCAAAAESRGAYLRRLSQTPIEAAWWGRQEPLCCDTLGSSSTFAVWPEVAVIFMARLVETWTLTTGSRIVAALLWPLHNALLGLWILAICMLTLWGGALQVIQILIWGSRRTGMALQHVWKEQIGLLVVNIDRTCEPHQALACRLVGLTLLPATYTIHILNKLIPSLTLAGTSFVFLLGFSWWYWMLVVPWLSFMMLGAALFSGFCFAVIEFAGV